MKQFILDWAKSDAAFDRRSWDGISKADRRHYLLRSVAGLIASAKAAHQGGQEGFSVWGVTAMILTPDRIVEEILAGDLS